MKKQFERRTPQGYHAEQAAFKMGDTMPRKPRFENRSEGEFYHVTARGAGRRVIFEDDIDRASYLKALFRYVDESSGSLAAWCLMDNHVHLLFHLELHELSDLMHRLHTKHAQFFNGRHGHVGPVFQSRYDCVPILSDAQLALTVRYIHRNPKDLVGQNWQTYEWSSYRDYLDGLTHCETGTVLEVFGEPDSFKKFHEDEDEIRFMRLDGYRRRISDAEASKILESQLGARFADTLSSLPKKDRNRELAIAYGKGLSIRQIERLTGIGRGIVQAATEEYRSADRIK